MLYAVCCMLWIIYFFLFFFFFFVSLIDIIFFFRIWGSISHQVLTQAMRSCQQSLPVHLLNLVMKCHFLILYRSWVLGFQQYPWTIYLPVSYLLGNFRETNFIFMKHTHYTHMLCNIYLTNSCQNTIHFISVTHVNYTSAKLIPLCIIIWQYCCRANSNLFASIPFIVWKSYPLWNHKLFCLLRIFASLSCWLVKVETVAWWNTVRELIISVMKIQVW